MDKSRIELLSNPTITKREYDVILKEVDSLCNSIWRYICQASKRRLEWWAFQNDVSLGDGNGSTGGHFDPETDSEFIEIQGDFGEFVSEITIPNVGPKNGTTVEEIYSNSYYEYHEGFPTALLWDENWKETVDKHIAEAIEKLTTERIAKYARNKQKNAKDKEKVARRKERIESILTKTQSILTAEEFLFLKDKLVR